jgi:Flp pilus assembly protein TadD
MALFYKGWRPFLCLLQSALLVWSLPVAAAVAESSDRERTGRYEQILFGKPRSSLSLDSRLQALEANLFGAPKKGAVSARLDAIGKLLGDQKPSVLFPPIAPRLASQSPNTVAAPGAGAYDSTGALPEAAPSRQPASGEPEGNARELLRQAVGQYGQGNTPEAERLFRRVLSLDPGNGDANFNLGAILESRGDLDGALKHYRAALAAYPDDPEVKQAVASTQQQLNDRRQALARAREKQQKDQLKRLADSAAAAYRNGNYDEAIRNLETVGRQAPGDAEVQYALGQAWRGKSDYNRARYHLRRATSLDPANSLYQKALAELDSDVRGQEIASAGQDDGAPPGQIVPFENVDPAPPRGRAGDRGRIGDALSGLIGGAGGGFGSLAGFGGGLGSGVGYAPVPAPEVRYGGGGGFGGTRLRRAAIGGLAGAAIGAMLGRGTEGGLKRGAVQGAIYGGMAGFLFGGF